MLPVSLQAETGGRQSKVARLAGSIQKAPMTFVSATLRPPPLARSKGRSQRSWRKTSERNDPINMAAKRVSSVSMVCLVTRSMPIQCVSK
ncbi:hypothetical protein LZ31DRAFT_550598 [Colletotrichum somersetense]|nr:hypothetical protein LZ31DRAFT_550598 [Colletotrichum somersetense]